MELYQIWGDPDLLDTTVNNEYYVSTYINEQLANIEIVRLFGENCGYFWVNKIETED